jgi:hypothetical protein
MWQETTHAAKSRCVFQNKIRSNDFDCHIGSTNRGPISQVGKNLSQNFGQRGIHFIRNQSHASRSGRSCHDRLDSRAEQNSSTCGGIKNSNRITADSDLRGHVIGDRDWCQIEPVFFSMLSGDPSGVCRTDPVSAVCRTLRLVVPIRNS